jgi:hypothetical protein
MPAREIIVGEVHELADTHFHENIDQGTLYITGKQAMATLQYKTLTPWSFDGVQRPIAGTLLLVDQETGEVFGATEKYYEFRMPKQ